jgi:8-oxo-dGTP diphosphatase
MLRRGGQQWYADGRDTWAHPGGWMDFGESAKETAERETVEETGVVVSAVEVMGTHVNPNDAGTLWVVNLFVRCEYDFGDPRVMEPEKCPEVAWVPLGEIDGLPLFHPTRVFHDLLRATDGR